jgi:hypothetical protein
MTGDDTAVTVEKWEENRGLKNLRLRTGPGFPKKTRTILAVFQDQVYVLTQNGGVLQLSSQRPDPLSNYLAQDKLNFGNYYSPSTKNHLQTADLLSSLTPVLVARALDAPNIFPVTISAPRKHADLQLLVAAPAPASLQLQGKGFAHEDGWVLYVQDVSKP